MSKDKYLEDFYKPATASQKRAETLANKYGPDWRKKMGQLAKKTRERNSGTKQYSEAGKKGGASKAIKAPDTYAFKDKELASKAGKKGSDKRWGKKGIDKDDIAI